MSETVLLSLIGGVLATIQALGMAWINHSINKNACGGENCLKTIQASKDVSALVKDAIK